MPVFLFFTLLISYSHAQQVIYFEGFEQGIPEDFNIVDVDGQIPVIDSSGAEAFGFLNAYDNGWVLQLNPDNLEDSIVSSTSWYDPLGIADDWLITPQISIPDTGEFFLQWRASAANPNFADGYEVLISTGGNEIADFTELILAVEEEEVFWKTYRISLAAYANENIHIAFRNNSDDKLVLYLDDIYIADSAATVGVDISLIPWLTPDIYAAIPNGQQDTTDLGIIVSNAGVDTAAEVGAIVEVFESLDFNNVIFSDDFGGTFNDLSPSDSILFIADQFYVPQDTGLKVVLYTGGSEQENPIVDNEFTGELFDNNFSIELLAITDTVLARSDEFFTGQANSIWPLPVGEGNRTILGSLFDFINPEVVTSATGFILPDSANVGDEVFFSIYTIDDNDTSFQFVEQGRSLSYTIQEEDIDFIIGITLPFVDGGITTRANKAENGVSLDEGVFMLAMQGADYLPLLSTREIYVPGTNWFTWDSLAQDDVWLTLEDWQAFLADSTININFNPQRVFMLRANVSGCGTFDGELVTSVSDTAGGVASVIPRGGTPPYTYVWESSTGDTLAIGADSTLSGLEAGRYNVLLQDSKGCEEFFLAVIGPATSASDPLAAGINLLNIYPNPARDYLNLQVNLVQPDYVQVRFYDLRGRTQYVRRSDLSTGLQELITVGEWTPGIYILEISTSKGAVYERMVIE